MVRQPPVGGEWLQALSQGNYGTVGGYGDAGSWNQWLANQGQSTLDASGQLAAMTGLNPQQAQQFGVDYGVPGFDANATGFGSQATPLEQYYAMLHANQNQLYSDSIAGG